MSEFVKPVDCQCGCISNELHVEEIGRVSCPSCLMAGPVGARRDDAVIFWNKMQRALKAFDGVMGDDELAVQLHEKIEAMLDTEEEHVYADDRLCELLETLGYPKTVKVFREMDKWYA